MSTASQLRAMAERLGKLSCSEAEEIEDAMLEAAAALIKAAEENERMRDLIDWLDAWVTYAPEAYSKPALDGLFHGIHTRIAALSAERKEGER